MVSVNSTLVKDMNLEYSIKLQYWSRDYHGFLD